jgi:ATP-dependent protease HslVU (ClpYQ) ATPase subunit
MTSKDDCFVPCDTDALLDKDVIGRQEKGKPIDINLKNRLQRRIVVSSPV